MIPVRRTPDTSGEFCVYTMYVHIPNNHSPQYVQVGGSHSLILVRPHQKSGIVLCYMFVACYHSTHKYSVLSTEYNIQVALGLEWCKLRPAKELR